MPNLYRDRKMLKWLPFEALEPQRAALKRVFQKNSESSKPSLSEDQHKSNQYKIEEALATGETVSIVYFESHHRYKVLSPILKVDCKKNILYTKNHCLALDEIIEVD